RPRARPGVPVPIPLGPEFDRVLGQPLGAALRGARLRRAARDAPRDAGRRSAPLGVVMPEPKYRHAEGEKWHEVRAIAIDGRRASVWERWLEFTPELLTIHAR